MVESCQICQNNENNRIITAREMMFGLREEFPYLECGRCGTIQLADVPDLARFYPNDYLSMSAVNDIEIAKTLSRRVASRFAGKTLRGERSALGNFVLSKKPWLADHFPDSLRRIELTCDSRILDVGCGTGRLLETLHHFGFRELSGLDAFIEKDLSTPPGIRVRKGDLSEASGQYDLVMLHHVFEHLPDPRKALRDIAKIVSPKGTALIRMPVASYAWEKYGVDWVQLDAPRHLFIFRENTFVDLAGEEGFEVRDVYYDSTAMQFWGSEQYKLDVPLKDERSHDLGQGTLFSSEQLAEWERLARELNSEGRGDQASFYLRKI